MLGVAGLSSFTMLSARAHASVHRGYHYPRAIYRPQNLQRIKPQQYQQRHKSHQLHLLQSRTVSDFTLQNTVVFWSIAGGTHLRAKPHAPLAACLIPVPH